MPLLISVFLVTEQPWPLRWNGHTRRVFSVVPRFHIIVRRYPGKETSAQVCILWLFSYLLYSLN
jgi:hypothetical protein